MRWATGEVASLRPFPASSSEDGSPAAVAVALRRGYAQPCGSRGIRAVYRSNFGEFTGTRLQIHAPRALRGASFLRPPVQRSLRARWLLRWESLGKLMPQQ